jgi:hypothetical protein
MTLRAWAFALKRDAYAAWIAVSVAAALAILPALR